ncbi:hypothetical protein [Geodermatophilus sp. CPCC 206100]|uniref:hypothetical protein n=1 Tax=Geodermatophilus sp. CPCC 206100 TaxID=3020054 RepID=UPI003B004F4A
MPVARRTAAAVALVLAAAGCTADERRGDGSPALDTSDLVGTVDLDDAVGSDVVLYDLASAPDGTPVALLGAPDSPQSWLVELTVGEAGPTAVGVRAVPAVSATAQLVVAPDGTVLVADDALLTLPPRAAEPTAIPWQGGRPDAAALTTDGRTLYAARGPAITAVDVATGAVTGTGTAPAPVTHLAPTPDGGLAALVAAPRPAGGTGAELVTLDAALRPVGEPVELVRERESTGTGLQVTADGTAVAAVHLGESRATGRLVSVVDGALRTSADLEGAGDTALDLVVSPDGRLASVPLADLSYPAELVTIDLASGERVGAVKLCDGTGVFGAVTPLGQDGDVVVTGACIDGDGPRSTAFVVG